MRFDTVTMLRYHIAHGHILPLIAVDSSGQTVTVERHIVLCDDVLAFVY